ncbi:O-antigen ligase family protein [Bradyrhizobium jicamae]|uniref:O-antigen ligase family protein n=1 Tax=Bradyrhizobium jicamae TaxID=280332 RepID=UPI001BA601F2|nr:O-antigen ligase family protein [Bradyrhizobium jicamae]MBR0753919.1 O-antigen ligase family protein [Bradyrhizobium jicamae]
MTIEASVTAAHLKTTTWPIRFRAACSARPYRLCTDFLAVLTAASLPWSTSLPAIFILLWLLMVIPTIDWELFVLDLADPSRALPLCFVLLAVLGLSWSDATWADRLHGIKPVAKLLLILFLLYDFQRSQRGHWVFVGFLISCTLLMVLSWIVLIVPEFKIAHTASDGVPVKNYIDQSQEFALCAFALAWPMRTAWRKQRWLVAIACATLILLFVANMLFVVSARTVLVTMPVLLALFAWRYLTRRAGILLFAGVVLAGIVVWSTSPYLRQRIADIGVEYQAQDTSGIASTAQRLTYWQKSLKFVADAPLFGHGTGSIRQQFTRDAEGQSGLRAEIVNNPHNQTLNVAIQWGLLGVLVLYAMWVAHTCLFRGDSLACWIGLVVVAQNVVSSLLNSHLFDFHEGWIYVLGVGVAGGMALRQRIRGGDGLATDHLAR